MSRDASTRASVRGAVRNVVVTAADAAAMSTPTTTIEISSSGSVMPASRRRSEIIGDPLTAHVAHDDLDRLGDLRFGLVAVIVTRCRVCEARTVSSTVQPLAAKGLVADHVALSTSQ